MATKTKPRSGKTERLATLHHNDPRERPDFMLPTARAAQLDELIRAANSTTASLLKLDVRRAKADMVDLAWLQRRRAAEGCVSGEPNQLVFYEKFSCQMRSLGIEVDGDAVDQVIYPDLSREAIRARRDRLPSHDVAFERFEKAVNAGHTDPEVAQFRNSFEGTPAEIERGVEDLGLLDRKNGANHQGTKSTKKRAESNGEPTGPTMHANVDPAAKNTSPWFGDVPRAIPVGKIRPFRHQVRKHFDPDALRRLADWIKKDGQLQEAVVRTPVNGEFERIAGERRWRACKLAGVPTLRARVLDVSEEEAIRIHGEENVGQESLNPIEEATWLKLMRDQAGYTQEALANIFRRDHDPGTGGAGGGKAAGKRDTQSQGAVSNKLRLLELAPVLQAAVAAGKLSESHAVVLIPHARRADFSEAFVKIAEKEKWKLPALEYFEEDMIFEAYAGFDFIYPHTQQNGVKNTIGLAQAHAAELDLFPVPGERGAFATSKTKLWRKLLDDAAAKASKAQGTKRDAEERREKREAPKLSPVEKKARQAQLAKQHRARVNRWYLRWLQGRVLVRLSDEQEPMLDDATRTRLVLFFTLAHTHRQNADESDLTAPLKELSIKAPVASREHWRGGNVFARLAGVPGRQLGAVGLKLMRAWFAADLEKDREAHVREPDLRAIGRETSVDVGKEWTLDEGFLQLFTKDQLFELVREWKLGGDKHDRGAEQR